MPGDSASNVTIDITGITASFMTDYGTSVFRGTTAHLPLSRLVWGEYESGYRASYTHPLPVALGGQTGPIDVHIAGGTGITYTQSVRIANQTGVSGASADLHYIAVAGNTSGTKHVGASAWVQGITNGILVGVTGTIDIRSAMAFNSPDYGITTEGLQPHGSTYDILGILVQGTSAGATAYVGGETFPGYGFGVPVAITAGRRLSKLTDSVGVSGDVTILSIPARTSATDSISVYGYDGDTKVWCNMYAGDGVTLGHSGDALNVAVTNAGLTFQVDVSAIVGVTNATGGTLRVQGHTGGGGDPVVVMGDNAGAIDVISNSGVNATVSGTVTIDDANILQELQGSTGELLTRLTDIKTGTNHISAIRTDLKTGNVRATISSITKPPALFAGTVNVSTSASALATNTELKAGVTIKSSPNNDNNILIGNRTLAQRPTEGYLLEPGESIYLEIDNLNKIYHIMQGISQLPVVLHYVGS